MQREPPLWKIIHTIWCPAEKEFCSLICWKFVRAFPMEKSALRFARFPWGTEEDPARLVFTSKTGPAIATSLVDLGDRFRLIINDVECKKAEKPMPKLPVGSAFWTPMPDLATGAEAWILAGGAHHTAFSYDLTAEQMGDWAAAMGIEAVYIDKDTTIRNFKNELRWNEVAFRK